MKSKLKWVSGVLGGVLALSLIFGAGVYAAQNWLTFEDEQVSDADDNLERIMDILREVNTEKGLTKEQNSKLIQEVETLKTKLENADQTELVSQLQAEINELKTQLENAPEDQTGLVSELQAEIERLKKERPAGLAKENQTLREENEFLNEELRRANEAVTNHNSNTEKALTEAQGYVDPE